MKFPEQESSVIDAVSRAASDSGHSQWIGQVVDIEGVDLLECYAQIASDDRFLWKRPEGDAAFVTWGRLDEIESAGPRRFEDVAAWSADVLSRFHWLGESRPRTAPLFVGGFGFEEAGPAALEWKAFPAARFLLPAAIVERWASGARLTVLARVEPGASRDAVAEALSNRRREAHAVAAGRSAPASVQTEARTSFALDGWRDRGWPPGPRYSVQSDRAHAVFASQVHHALAAIESGELEKVVLARSLRVDHEGCVDIPGFLGRLAAVYPSCTVVAMARGDDTFLAATPERLVRVEDDRVEAAALAGSAPRGRTPQEDRALADELRSSAKERAEHAHVVDAYRDVLDGACIALEAPEAPGLRQLFGIQHLETPLRGRLRATGLASDTQNADASAHALLRLAARLHPTPAVGGVPAATAGDWLRRWEGLDRGWYAAPVGWLDAAGGGDLCVALRSALIHQRGVEGANPAASRAWLFAGAGIVAGSDPERELAETRVKLRALLAPLTEI